MGSKDKYSVEHDVFDSFTEKTLFKLQSQGQLKDLKSDLLQGKEAHIFLSHKKDGSAVIVKIYRLENANFNKMHQYIRSDPRYQHLKGNKRQTIFHWVQREFRNLLLAREAGVRVPTPYAFDNNVLIMQFIGDGDIPAMQLKNTSIENPESFIEDIFVHMKLLYQKAELVHADLSMFNILVHDQKPYFIDMSQSTSIADVNAKDYLRRDIKNIAQYAKKVGVIVDEEEQFQKITKKSLKE